MPKTASQWRSEPPPQASTGTPKKYDWVSIGQAARSRPGEWLLVDDEARASTLQRIRDDRLAGLRHPGWRYEAVTRNNRRTEDGARICELWISASKEEA